MKKANIYEILRRKYPSDQYVLMEEVSNAAGFSRSNSADYIAMGLWPSRGLLVEGIELKSNRSDWLRELKNHQKAESIFKYCDLFWLLTTDETIAKPEEIPVTWGWMCIKNEKIIYKKPAPSLSPIPISRSFAAAMLKRASDKSQYILKSEIQDKIDEAKKIGEENAAYSRRSSIEELARLKEQIKKFEDASGIDLSYMRWYNKPEDIGKAVRFLLDGGLENAASDLKKLEKSAHSILENIRAGINVLSTETINL